MTGLAVMAAGVAAANTRGMADVVTRAVASGTGAPGSGREVTGALVAGAAALLYDAGYVLEKRALAGLPAVGLDPRSLLRTVGRNRRWAVGFAAMLGGLGLQVVALTLAPVSVVQPIMAGGLVALAAAGSSLLGERLERRHVVALVLVLASVVAVAVSARGTTSLAQRVPAGRLAAFGVVVTAAVMVALRGRRPGLAAGAVAAGLLYGLGAVAEKAVATRMVEHGVVRGALASLATAYPWVFLVVTAGGMVVFQSGLQAHPASLMASLTNLASTVCALVGAAVVFGERLLPAGWWSVLRVAGFAAVVLAVGLLSVDQPAPTAAERGLRG